MAEDPKAALKKWEKNNPHYGKLAHQSRVPYRGRPRSTNDNRPSEKKNKSVASELEDLRRENRKLKLQQDDEKQHHDKIRDAKQATEEDKGLSDMGNGFNEIFDKTYHAFYRDPETGSKKKFSFEVEMKPATGYSENLINAQVARLTNGLGKYYEAANYDLIEAFAAMRVLGVKVPRQFKEPQHLTRDDLLMMVYQDYLNWEDNFRSYHKF